MDNDFSYIPMRMAFLSQVMTSDDRQANYAFTDSILLVTTSGRCLSHQQNTDIQKAQTNLVEDILQRHQWLEDHKAEGDQLIDAILPSKSIHKVHKIVRILQGYISTEESFSILLGSVWVPSLISIFAIRLLEVESMALTNYATRNNGNQIIACKKLRASLGILGQKQLRTN